MRRRRRTSGEQDAEIDMTPMLDIVFIMLIFFIVTATFLDERGVDFTQPPPPPDEQENLSKPKPAITVYVDERDSCVVDGRATECDRAFVAVESLMADKPGANIILRINREASHRTMVMLKDGFDDKGRPIKIEMVG